MGLNGTCCEQGNAVSNRSRYHRRRADKTAGGPASDGPGSSTPPRSPDESSPVPTCPAVITTGAGLVTVEHYHRHGCPQLDQQPEADAP